MSLPILLYLLMVLSGDPAAAHPAWGIGIVRPIAGIGEREGEFLFPQASRIRFARSPEGEPVGKLWRGENVTLEYQEGDGDVMVASDTGIQQVGYDVHCVQFYAMRNNQIAIKGAPGDGFLWVAMYDWVTTGYEHILWQDFLLENERLYYPVPERGLNLRKKPDANSALLTTMRGDLYTIAPTGDKNGLWIKAKVERYDLHYCEGGAPKEKWVGWLKAIDDTGYPNIWFYPRGC